MSAITGITKQLAFFLKLSLNQSSITVMESELFSSSIMLCDTRDSYMPGKVVFSSAAAADPDVDTGGRQRTMTDPCQVIMVQAGDRDLGAGLKRHYTPSVQSKLVLNNVVVMTQTDTDDVIRRL